MPFMLQNGYHAIAHGRRDLGPVSLRQQQVGEGGPGHQPSPISELGRPKTPISASLAVATDKLLLSMAKLTFRLPSERTKLCRHSLGFGPLAPMSSTAYAIPAQRPSLPLAAAGHKLQPRADTTAATEPACCARDPSLYECAGYH